MCALACIRVCVYVRVCVFTVGDYDKVLAQFIAETRFAEAIALLNEAPFEKGSFLAGFLAGFFAGLLPC